MVHDGRGGSHLDLIVVTEGEVIFGPYCGDGRGCHIWPLLW